MIKIFQPFGQQRKQTISHFCFLKPIELALKKPKKPRAIQPLEEDLKKIQGLNQTGIVLGENQQEY